MKLGRIALASALAVAVNITVGVSAATHSEAARDKLAVKIDPNIHKIKHIIMIMQENRSFDSYFGKFPGADGIPPGVCIKDPRNGGCRRPWVDHHDSNANNPHSQQPFIDDVNGGKMNGFVAVAERMLCKPKPARCHPDVMGYHVAKDIPNYWKYAQNFVLQDRFFEAPGSWSLPAGTNRLLRPSFLPAAAGRHADSEDDEHEHVERGERGEHEQSGLNPSRHLNSLRSR